MNLSNCNLQRLKYLGSGSSPALLFHVIISFALWLEVGLIEQLRHK